MTAALIGLGIFIMFCDLPSAAKQWGYVFQWVLHIGVFILLTALHGASAEGVVLAGIATLVFRFLLGRAAARYDRSANAPAVPEMSREQAAEQTAQLLIMIVLVGAVVAVAALH